MESLSNLTRDAAPGIFPVERLDDLVRLTQPGQANPGRWEAYVEQTRYGFPNEGEFRLFPMVKLALGPHAAFASRQAWFAEAEANAQGALVRNDAARSAMTAVLHEAGIQARWTKGVALALNWYREPGLRPSGDLDLICRFQDMPALSRAMQRQGWTRKLGPVDFDRPDARSAHGASWSNLSGAEVDVTWLPRLTFAHDPWLLETLFAGEALVEDANPTWLLIEAIDHGLSANRVWPIRWVVDCLALLDRAEGHIDWDFVVEVARRYQMATILLAGLSALVPFTAKLPDRVIRQLSDLPHPSLQAQELTARLTLLDPRENFMVSRRYNTFMRASLRDYRAMIPSPLARQARQSLQLRLGIAARNVAARLRHPIRS